ncbi:MAG: nitrile hydratase subunit beta [Verrucomicrobia bacterium]|nr:nitrile hydratase subunit beta [Verrucomicrobiota bacterium]
MNGVHDMGGMHGMGSIQYEKNEPVFHEPWEARIFALNRAVRAWRIWTADASRHAVELIPAPEYLRMSYYEQRLHSLVELMIKSGLVSRAEVENGKSAPNSLKATPALTADAVPSMLAKGKPTSREVPVAARFKAGQAVRARNINPTGHTRLPRYARGKLGTIHLDHGVYVFPDTNADSLGENPQHLYSVRFSARELWGEQASSRDAVYLDMWDDYLECA